MEIPEENLKFYFSEKLPHAREKGKIRRKHILQLLQVILGHKPGATVHCRNRGLLEEILECFELHSRAHADAPSLLVTSEEERFEMLEKDADGSFTEKSIGRFLGYPEEAVKYYSSNPIGLHCTQEIKELREKRSLEKDEIEILNTLSYVPKPAEKEIRKAVEEAKMRRDAIKNLDSNLGTDFLERYFTPLKKTTFYLRKRN